MQILKEGKNPDGAFKLGEFFNTVTACDIIFKQVGWIHPLKEFIPTIDANAYPGLKFYIDSETQATEWHLLRRCPIHWFVKTQLDEIRDLIARDQMTARRRRPPNFRSAPSKSSRHKGWQVNIYDF